ncbi:transglutaminase-like domain-containing protein [Cellulomonas sp. DKR-3]|uniref:Transglutaminase-like domain-containing protein n=1 Tax=Cellulomonas fulva TaxID=2835530 RepID=A0ABS5U347_9CELL|nr:transglutaminaseTgpA domain-containing protein [Cellulomonas fulva]MBT0995822.1 transglutaminase-like domain-containing protein [Cellulomonas fulva]
MNVLHTVPPRGWRAVAATGLCWFATVTSLHALTNLVGATPWRSPIVLLLLVVAAVVVVVRAVTRSVRLPSVVGLVVAGVAVLLRYGGPPGRLQLVPDTASWDRTVALWGEGLRLVDESTVPVDVTRPLELMIAVGAIAVLLAADLLAVALGMAAWSGLAFAAMWTPTIALGFPARGSALFWTGLAYLLLLALSVVPQPARDDGARRVGLASGAAVGILAVALLAGPPLAALPGWSSWGLPNLGSGAAGPVDLSSDLDVRQSLGTRSSQVALRYTVRPPGSDEAGADGSAAPSPSAASTAPPVNANSIGPLRAFTLMSFDGRSWHADEPTDDGLPVDDGLLAADPALRGTAPDPRRGTLAQVDMEVGVLEDRQLPISTFPRTLQLDGPWRWDVDRDTVDGADPTTEGMRWRSIVEIPDLTGDDLEGVGIGEVGDPRATEVPPTAHAADIAALAREVTQDATTPYEQAMALQTYLRSAVNFTYDTRIDPAQSPDAVWDFLQSRKGYCVQFATAMTVMARSLGIPARVGVGFLPGTADDGSYVITGQQSHAWPELAFDGYGWVRFEPTPAVQTGAPPIWSDPYADTIGSGPTEPAIPTAAPGPVSTATVAPGVSAPVDTESDVPWVPAAATVLLVLAAGTGGVLLLTRRRSRVLAELTPEQAWSRLRRALARYGVRWGASTTPRAAVRSVTAQVDAWSVGAPAGDGAGLTESATLALSRLALAVEQARYAPHAVTPEPGQLAGWVDEVTGGVRAARGSRGRRSWGRRSDGRRSDGRRSPVTTS